jgi:hypothetical protein
MRQLTQGRVRFGSKTAAPFTCQRALHAAAVPRIAAVAGASVVTAESEPAMRHLYYLSRGLRNNCPSSWHAPARAPSFSHKGKW